MKVHKTSELLLSTIVKEVTSNQIEINQTLQYSNDEKEIKLKIIVVSDSYIDCQFAKEFIFKVQQ